MKTKRKYYVGDEWLYYKIYLGTKTADKIIVDVVKPITTLLLKKQYISKWFFVRYSDPDNHIRLRLHLLSNDYLSLIINTINQSLKYYTDTGLVWKIVIDTYNRELERYGFNSIEYAEELFYNDSVLCSQILSLALNKGDEGEVPRWCVGLRSIDEYINDFRYTIENKFIFLTFLRNSFLSEFNADKDLKIQLSSKYRKNEENICEVLNYENTDINSFKEYFPYIKDRSLRNKQIVEKILCLQREGKLNKELSELIWSYLHMSNNRLYKSKQRLHELVLYDMLWRFYRSKLAKMGVNTKELSYK